MNIIWVSLYPPLPLNFGGAIATYKRLEQLKDNNNIFLFYINEENNKQYDVELSKMCKEVHSYPRNAILNIDTLKYIWITPYTAATRTNKNMQSDITRCIQTNKIDVINVEFPQMCINLLKIKKKYNIPINLYQHNNEWNRFLQLSDTVSGIKQLLYKRESRLLYKMEKKLFEDGIVDYYCFLSDKDIESYTKIIKVKKEKISYVPLGADDCELSQSVHDGKNIIFCGAMDSELNQEAVKWFVNNVFNKIKRIVCDVKFYIVGKNPSRDVLALNSDDIIVTGTVDDIREYYQIADLVVVPLLHGGGVKVKLLEAVGYNKNIVTTTVGIEGTGFDWKTQIPVTDDPGRFAKLCVDILSDEEYAKTLRVNTHDFFIENYTYKSIGESFQKILENLSQGKSDED